MIHEHGWIQLLLSSWQVAFRLLSVTCNLFANEIYGKRGGVGMVKESWEQDVDVVVLV